MIKEAKDRAAFTLADLGALRWLAIALGAVACGLCIVTKDPGAMLLAVGLAGLMMTISPLAIHLLRRRKLQKAGKSHQPPPPTPG